jgi:hypothetical protein
MYTKFNRPRHKHPPYVTKEVFMAAIDDLNTAVAALQAEDVLVLAGLASLQAQVTTLNTTIANSPNVDPAIETAAQAVQAEVAKFQAALTPTAPVAAAAPAVPAIS